MDGDIFRSSSFWGSRNWTFYWRWNLARLSVRVWFSLHQWAETLRVWTPPPLLSPPHESETRFKATERPENSWGGCVKSTDDHVIFKPLAFVSVLVIVFFFSFDTQNTPSEARVECEPTTCTDLCGLSPSLLTCWRPSSLYLTGLLVSGLGRYHRTTYFKVEIKLLSAPNWRVFAGADASFYLTFL